VLWINNAPFDLNSAVAAPGWELIEARGINNNGEIVGVGRFHGSQRAFLLRPNPGALTDPSRSDAAVKGEDSSLPVRQTSRHQRDSDSALKRQIEPVKAVLSQPVMLYGVTCQTIVQAEWRLPEDIPQGNLENWREWPEINMPASRLAAFGQTNLFVGMRFTNRSSSPVYLQFVFLFQPELKPFESEMPTPILGNSVPTNVRGLAESPLISPGQSFTISRPSRLAWYGADLRFECLSMPGETVVKQLKPGKYSLALNYGGQEGGILRKDSPYKTLTGHVYFNPVTIEIR
jgi:hypothetical protein